MYADAAVNFAAGIWALKSERIDLDPRFNLWRIRSATSAGRSVSQANGTH
jgi:hypothetical protein